MGPLDPPEPHARRRSRRTRPTRRTRRRTGICEAGVGKPRRGPSIRRPSTQVSRPGWGVKASPVDLRSGTRPSQCFGTDQLLQPKTSDDRIPIPRTKVFRAPRSRGRPVRAVQILVVVAQGHDGAGEPLDALELTGQARPFDLISRHRSRWKACPKCCTVSYRGNAGSPRNRTAVSRIAVVCSTSRISTDRFTVIPPDPRAEACAPTAGPRQRVHARVPRGRGRVRPRRHRETGARCRAGRAPLSGTPRL